MNRPMIFYKFCITAIVMIAGLSLLSFNNKAVKTGTLKITFINTANGKPVILRDSTYTNASGEVYTISKLKYYISNFSIPGSHQEAESDPYHLMNAENMENSFDITLQPGIYKNIHFLLGVDSTRNYSGAQTGALDPMNDMFWTWNSGYVIFKLEGTSPASTFDLQRIEHHIGGFKGSNNVTTDIELNFPESKPLRIKENSVTELFIETNLDHYWKGNTEIKISEIPVCTTAGKIATNISANFKSLFSINSIKYSE